MAVAHGCQSRGNGASSLDLPCSGILDCSADQGDRDVGGIEVVGAELCGVPDTVCEAEAEKSQLAMVAGQGQT